MPLVLLVDSMLCNLANSNKNHTIDTIRRIRHPTFDQHSLVGDVGLLHTEKSLKGAGASIAQLLDRSLAVGEAVEVNGWNYDFLLDLKYQKLYKATSTVLDPLTCVQHYGKAFDSSVMLCLDMWVAGVTGEEPLGCEMDPSAAAVVQVGGEPHIGALGLYAGGCLYPGWPAVFLNTFPYRMWIKANSAKEKP